tara:strand:- start:281 stop:517 length:237 start_codon:yes stop_codon:yes gene_type:complete
MTPQEVVGVVADAELVMLLALLALVVEVRVVLAHTLLNQIIKRHLLVPLIKAVAEVVEVVALLVPLVEELERLEVQAL